MSEPIVKISERWAEEKGECQTCPMCNDMIYGNAYRLVIDIGEKTIETPIVLCNSCADLSNKEDGLQ